MPDVRGLADAQPSILGIAQPNANRSKLSFPSIVPIRWHRMTLHYSILSRLLVGDAMCSLASKIGFDWAM